MYLSIATLKYKVIQNIKVDVYLYTQKGKEVIVNVSQKDNIYKLKDNTKYYWKIVAKKCSKVFEVITQSKIILHL